jgi:hypothetical protein
MKMSDNAFEKVVGFQTPMLLDDGIIVIRTGSVATPLWDKCENETHTPKSGRMESSGTPKNSELDCKGQISLNLSVLGVIGKVLKYRCPKWPCMSHLDICSPS